jgi:hypothetical protein
VSARSSVVGAVICGSCPRLRSDGAVTRWVGDR